MKILKFCFVILLFYFLFFIFSPNVFAVTETDGDLQVTYDDPLFPSSIIWYPGLSVTKPITVKNVGGSTHTTYINTGNSSQTGGIADIYLFKITEGPTAWYGGTNDKTMKNFWDAGNLTLSNIPTGNSTTYDITITMPFSAGNDYQNQTAKFDFTIGFVGTTETVTVSGGGGGAVAGATTTVCNDQKPGSAPILVSAISGTNNVTLNWNKAIDPVSYYLVAYGISPNNNSYGNPNVGDKNTTSYTVSNLSGSITYCFIVRAGNGCTPGDFSNQICTTPLGGTINGIANSFAPNVLGVSTPSAGLAAQKPGEIKGAETVAVCQNCVWWPMILAEAVLLLLYRKYRKKWWPSLLLPVAAYLLFRYFNRHCYLPDTFCRYFLVIDAGVFLLCWIDKIISLVKKP